MQLDGNSDIKDGNKVSQQSETQELTSAEAVDSQGSMAQETVETDKFTTLKAMIESLTTMVEGMKTSLNSNLESIQKEKREIITSNTKVSEDVNSLKSQLKGCQVHINELQGIIIRQQQMIEESKDDM